MCCDICPFFDECEELDELQPDCCPECPDFGNCQEKLEKELEADEDAEPVRDEEA